MKRYRLKPRFYVITLSTIIVTAGLAINHIDSVCGETVDRNTTHYIQVEQEEPEPVELESTYLGEYKITHYCPCEECCGKTDGITYTGTTATQGRTIAVDPDVIPLGSEVTINGQTYIAEDIGGAIKGKRIDIFVNSHEEALELGVDYAPVYLEG